MVKYLYCGSYTLEGVRGLVREKGSSRKGRVESAVKAMGGKLEVYSAFRGNDVRCVMEFPDNVTQGTWPKKVHAYQCNSN